MKAIGIVLFAIGALCVLFAIHPLLGLGGLIWAIAATRQVYVEWKAERAVRRSWAPGAGLTHGVKMRTGWRQIFFGER